MLRFRGGTDVISSDWESSRETFGFLDSYANFLGFIFFPGIWLAIRQKKFFLTILFSLLGLAFFQISGSRAMVLTLICVIYIDLLLLPISSLKKIALLLVLSMGAFGLHTFTRLVRGLGLVGFITVVASSGLVDHLSAYNEIDLSGGEGEIYEYYYYVINRNYDEYPYRSNITFTRLALFIYTVKPIS